MKRRILFLHEMLNLNKNEMLSKVFWTMADDPLKNDWIVTVKENLLELGIDDNLESIRIKKKAKFKKEIRLAIEKRAFEYLKEEIERKDMKKIIDIKYKKLKMQKYLQDEVLLISRKKLIFKFRTRMINVKSNYGKNDLCPLCGVTLDNQLHLLQCNVIKNSMPTIYTEEIDIKDAFSNNIEKLNSFAAILEKIIQRRDEILESQENVES